MSKCYDHLNFADKWITPLYITVKFIPLQFIGASLQDVQNSLPRQGSFSKVRFAVQHGKIAYCNWHFKSYAPTLSLTSHLPISSSPCQVHTIIYFLFIEMVFIHSKLYNYSNSIINVLPFRPTPPVDPAILQSMKIVGSIGYAPNLYNKKRNQVSSYWCQCFFLILLFFVINCEKFNLKKNIQFLFISVYKSCKTSTFEICHRYMWHIREKSFELTGLTTTNLQTSLSPLLHPMCLSFISYTLVHVSDFCFSFSSFLFHVYLGIILY